MWPRNRSADVLLQGGVRAVMPYLRHGLDMAHETERRGSPQTLVCTKTRRTYERQCAEHKADVMAMSTLLRVIDEARSELAALAARMAGATVLSRNEAD